MASIPEILDDPGNFWFSEIKPPKRRKGEEFRGTLTKAAVVTGGYGGWSRVARPRAKALTEWVGRDSVSIQIEFVLDDFSENRGAYIENACQILDELAGVEAHDPEPPKFELHSDPPGLIPHDYSRAAHVEWFIESLSWDADFIAYNRFGNRTRASGTIVVTQFVEDVRLGPVAKKKKASKVTRRKTYRVKRGDTLQKIAARKDVYKDAKKWKRIARANHIRDGKLGAAWIGKILKIP